MQRILTKFGFCIISIVNVVYKKILNSKIKKSKLIATNRKISSKKYSYLLNRFIYLSLSLSLSLCPSLSLSLSFSLSLYIYIYIVCN